MITLTRATAKAIRHACMVFHYAKAVPVATYAYNVYQDGEWCGVIIFGPGAAMNIAEPFGLHQGEVLELVRVALNGKQTTTSQCVAAALKQLHKDNPLVKIIVSFADMDQNHMGTIYQATNWIYLGARNIGTATHFIVNGRKIHNRSIGAMGGVQSIEWVRENLDPSAERFVSEGKHKYIFVYDKRLRKQYAEKAQPYPKREESR